MVINAELIKMIEATPDTIITLINGDTLIVRESVDEIVERVAAESNATDRQPILQEIQAVYSALNPLNLMFLRHNSVARFTPEPSDTEHPAP